MILVLALVLVFVLCVTGLAGGFTTCTQVTVTVLCLQHETQI